jgi:hypothetical protein
MLKDFKMGMVDGVVEGRSKRLEKTTTKKKSGYVF